MLAVELHLTALNAKTEPASEMVSELSRALADESAVALQWAFRKWRDKSPYFPSVHDVRVLVREYEIAERDRKAAEMAAREKRETEARRVRGECWGLADVLKRFKAIFDKKAMEPRRVVPDRTRTTWVNDTDAPPRKDPAAERAKLDAWLKEHPEIGVKV